MTLADLIGVMERTWPPAEVTPCGPFLVKSPDPGGNRVSAARLADLGDAPVGAADLDAAEALMRRQGRAPLFMVLNHQSALEAELEARGYIARDHTDALVAPAADLARVSPPVTAFTIWPPLAIQMEIWAAGGIDAARLAVMTRAEPRAKTSLFGRIADRPAGAAYIGIDGDTAMLHALEIAPEGRRKGLARVLMQAGADWASENGAAWLSVLVTRRNAAAQGLYASLGMTRLGSYHYRERTGGVIQ